MLSETDPKRYHRKRDHDKKVKSICDKETGWWVERFMSVQKHRCDALLCPYYLNEIDRGIIYMRASNPADMGPFVRGQRTPVFKKYHTECVPDEVRLMTTMLEVV